MVTTAWDRWVRIPLLALVLLYKVKLRNRSYDQERYEAGGWLDYCKHGNNIGTWWGPDILCGICEDGCTDWQEAYAEARTQVVRRRLNLNRTKDIREILRAAKTPEAKEHIRNFASANGIKI